MAALPAADMPTASFASAGHAPLSVPVPVSVSHEPSIKLTRGHSCVLCQQRKVRCDKNKPCANCVKAGVDCKVVPPQPPRRRKKKPQERELIDRLRKYETLLSQHGVDFEPIGQTLKPSDPASIDEIDEIEHGIEGLKTSPSSTGPDTERHPKWFQYSQDVGFAFLVFPRFILSVTAALVHINTQSFYPEHSSRLLVDSSLGLHHDSIKPVDSLQVFCRIASLTLVVKQYRKHDVALRDSSDDGSDGPVIHKAFDKMFDGQDGFPFVIGGSMASVTELHPPAVQIFQLWQIYLDNVNPLLKLTHTPTLQGQLIEAAANPSKTPKPLEALLFSIYFMAVISLTDDEVRETFKEDKTSLMAKYHRGTQQALVNAGFMRSADIVVLQAFLMYLIAVRQFVDPRALFCLIGIAVRIANRLGLHQDAEKFQFPPFEVELRRRLWWQLVIFDKRIAEMTGSSMTALSTSRGDCKWPLNISDTDLHVNAKDRIAPYAGPTEMLFSLTRFELTVAADPEGSRPMPNLGATAGNKSKFSYSPSPASSDMFTNAIHHNLPTTDLEGYIKYIEDKYLNHCDSKIPLHLFTFLMTRQAMSKLRIIDYFCRGYLQRYPDPNSLPPGPDRVMRESIFEEAVRILEYDNMVQSHETLRGFRWYTHMHYPLPAFVFLIQELRFITSGEACERAWAMVFENYKQRKMIENTRSPIHTAMGGMVVRAWDAHEAAEAQLGRPLPQQKLVVALREIAKKAKAANKDASSTQSRDAGSSSKVDISAMTGPASSGEKYTGPSHQPPQTQPSEADMHSTGSSPPIVSGPGGGGIEPVPGALFGAGNFDGINQNMFGSAMMPEDLGMMDWSSMTPWGGSFLGGGGYEFSPPNMATYQDQGPR